MALAGRWDELVSEAAPVARKRWLMLGRTEGGRRYP